MMVGSKIWVSALALPILGSLVAAEALIPRQSSTTGDSRCSRSMCVSGTLNTTTVQYVLSSRGETPGWMAIGFGQSMIGSPMVIMWANSDGSFTVSQRQASGYREPEVVDSPPRIATVATAASSASGDIKYAFTLPHDGQTTQNLVWAFGDTKPDTSDPKARLQQHSTMGRMNLDLSKSGDSGTPSGGGNGGNGGNPGSGDQNPPDDIPDDIPLLPYQRLIVAHAIFCTIGFLLFLPAGALLARYLRTFSNVWFKGHWIIQWLLAGSSIVIGVALGIQSVVKAGAMHLDDTHKKWGIALFVLYIVQCLLGAFIHFIKPAKPVGRPIQNYAHAVVGLLTIGIALYQVRTGYKYEWPATTGRGDLGKGADIVWYAWVVLLPVLYAAGLAFLPKQFRQEKEQRYNTTRMSLDRNRYSDEADRD